MALFKKKKKNDDEPDEVFDEGLGLTGSLAEEEKGGFFGKKKSKEDYEEPEPVDAPEEDEIVELPECSVECEICGAISPPGAPECETCGGTLTSPDGETENVQEITQEPIEAEPEMEEFQEEIPEPVEENIIEETPEPVAEDIAPEPEPSWVPLSEKDAKAAEKAIKKDVKNLDKQLKKGHISQEG